MKNKTTTKISLDQKSQLAKLIATENISIQHNNVKTASFDVKNRVLTLPIFKTKSADVYDMLIAHECAHALFTPYGKWSKINDDELRAYINVLEDCRIDKKIQTRYEGVVKNYINGFDILNKANFFGIKNRDMDKDFMLIDKINVFYKSSKRLKINFTTADNKWLAKVNSLTSFTSVVKLAKEMLAWQKKDIKSKEKDSDFSGSTLDKLYKLADKHIKPGESKDGEEEKKEESYAETESKDEVKEEDNKVESDSTNSAPDHGNGADEGEAGYNLDSRKFIAVTDQTYEKNRESLTDRTCDYNYVNLPDVNLNKVIVSNKTFLSEMREYIASERKHYASTHEYLMWLKNDYKKYIKDNMKTVNYLVKEFEMKKSATAYKRASTDKTGTIDPLKLKDYKFSDDIFKRLTIIPTEKNHGMMMLLDWSGSMANDLKKTIDQLINLVMFCRKINIPFKVYMFTTEYSWKQGLDKYNQSTSKSVWKYKSGDMYLENFNLVELADHKSKKKDLEESLMYVYNMGLCYDNSIKNSFWSNEKAYEGSRFHMPNQYNLGTTPLNEALVTCLKIVPMFKRKYNVEKMTFITLTDGGANYTGEAKVILGENGLTRKHKDECRTGAVDKNAPYVPVKTVIKVGKRSYVNEDSREGLTNLMLTLIQKEHGIKTIGFYVLKQIKWWDISSYVKNFKSYEHRNDMMNKIKATFQKEKAVLVHNKGYNKYFLLNGKSMKVQNADLSAITDDSKTASIKSVFSKSMKGRITSRTVLNKFIEEVA
tara:strand:+ start:233 stop:2530 length:2298 start_codon:yes stop_codon:yes gene_type:complete